MKLLTGFNARMDEYLKNIENALSAAMQGDGEMQKNVTGAMSYSLLSGGKHVRAVLLLASYNLFKEDYNPAIPFACAVEMIHTYSLIHDDLPCMDDDDMRRGKPSCHIEFGEAAALLAGDGLLTLAFETMSEPVNVEIFGTGKTLDVIRLFAKAAGAAGMVGGQMLDLENESRKVTPEELRYVNSKKTGALITAACEAGCVLAGADKETIKRVLSYSSKIGLAFQIVDDILDVRGSPEELGKPVGSDLANNKPTYATLYGVEKAGEIVRQLTREARNELETTALNIEFLCAFAETLADRTH